MLVRLVACGKALAWLRAWPAMPSPPRRWLPVGLLLLAASVPALLPSAAALGFTPQAGCVQVPSVAFASCGAVEPLVFCRVPTMFVAEGVGASNATQWYFVSYSGDSTLVTTGVGQEFHALHQHPKQAPLYWNRAELWADGRPMVFTTPLSCSA